MSSTDDENKLFVAGLPDSTTEDVLRDMFAEAGLSVADVSLPRDRMTGRPRGFAFVRLGGPDEVERALSELHGRILGVSSISVRRFNAAPPARGERPVGDRPRGPAQDTSDRTLFVGNLPYDATPEEVEGMLRGVGVDGIARVHLPLDPDGRRRGFGFVTLNTADAARLAVDQTRGVALRGRSVVCNLAQPKGPPGSGPGPRPDRAPGAPPPGAGAAPANRFGPPAKPGGSRADYANKRKKGEGEGGGRPSRDKRASEERWRNDDD